MKKVHQPHSDNEPVFILGRNKYKKFAIPEMHKKKSNITSKLSHIKL